MNEIIKLIDIILSTITYCKDAPKTEFSKIIDFNNKNNNNNVVLQTLGLSIIQNKCINY